ncbi:2'-5' RNA ligase family protein [Ferroplasma sp.]|uniref:2'-5' RNA ligase family protein n=1 Tax=Ferroplasma sp. TaxID=2591003 RepID=UPI00307D64D8
MQYTLILKPDLKTRRKITYKKKKLQNLYGYTGSLSNKGVHITMVYFKNSQFLDIAPVKRLCKDTMPFSFKISGIDYFERIKKDKKSYIVFYKVILSIQMEKFHKSLINAMDGNSTDSGKFVPHITLIRKNVNDDNIDNILNMARNSKIDNEFLCRYLILGKRSSENSRWHFEHLDFRKI